MERAYYCAANSDMVGDITVGEASSIWYQCVLRGDVNQITIGRETNIQDGSIIHVTQECPTHIGHRVSVGHRVILHGCTIEDRVLIGMGSIILNGAQIGSGSLIGAGALVLENQIIPPNSLVVGSPARVIRSLTPENQASIDAGVNEYLALAPTQLPKISL